MVKVANQVESESKAENRLKAISDEAEIKERALFVKKYGPLAVILVGLLPFGIYFLLQ
jgi:hypothetical protein